MSDAQARSELEEAVQRWEDEAKGFRGEVQTIVQKQFDERRRFLSENYEQAIRDLEVLERNEREAAIARFEEFIARYPDDAQFSPDAMFRLAELYYEKANDDFELATLAHREEAKRALAEGREPPPEPMKSYAPSIALYQQLITGFPDYKFADGMYYLLAYCLAEMGQGDEAQAAYAILLERYPKSAFVPEAWVRLGDWHFDEVKADSLQRATEAFTRMYDFPAHPLFARAIYKLGWTYYRMDDFGHAVESFTRLLDHYVAAAKRAGGKPDGDVWPEAIQYTAISFSDETWGGIERAKAFFAEKGGRSYEGEIYARLGDVYFDETKYGLAVEAYRQVLAASPLAPEAPRDPVEDRARLVARPAVRPRGEGARAARPRRTPRGRPGGRRTRVIPTSSPRCASSRRRACCARRASTTRRRRASSRRGSSRPPSPSTGSRRTPTATTSAASRTRSRPTSSPTTTPTASTTPSSSTPRRGCTRRSATTRPTTGTSRRRRSRPSSPGRARSPGCSAAASSRSARSSSRPTGARRTSSAPRPSRTRSSTSCGTRTCSSRAIPSTRRPRRSPTRPPRSSTSTATSTRRAAGSRRSSRAGPTAEVAQFAANLIIESYLTMKDWASVEQASARLQSSDVAKNPKLHSTLQKFKLGGRFKRAMQLMEAKGWEDAAKLFLALVAEEPQHEFADKALYNAASCFESARRFESALRLYERLAIEYPRAALADEALFRVGYNAENTYDFDKAVERYLALVENYPGSKHRKDALYNAARSLENLQRYDRAAAAFARYASLYPDAEDAARTQFHAALVYEKMGDRKREIEALQEFVKRFAQAKEHELVVQSHLEIALAHLAARRREGGEGELPGGGRGVRAARAEARPEPARGGGRRRGALPARRVPTSSGTTGSRSRRPPTRRS